MSATDARISDETLRRNIWRSLLIMKSATLKELPGVVSGLSYKKARFLMRDLETHGYAKKGLRHGRPEYTQAIDCPSLPAVCGHCGRAFNFKACASKAAKRQRDTQRETETQTESHKVRKARKGGKTRKVTTALTATAVIARAITEVHHDAA